MTENNILKKMKEAIIDGETDQATTALKEALDSGMDYKVILNKGVIEAAAEVGELYEKEEYFLADMLITGEVLNAVMEQLGPIIKQSADEKMGTILIGTVAGDVHDIGKSLVCSLLKGQGYDVVDLGTDVSPEEFAEKAKEINPKIIGLSALLTASVSKMRETIMLLKEENITSKIIIGGGIVSKESCAMVGADDCAKDGWEGVKKIKTLMGDS